MILRVSAHSWFALIGVAFSLLASCTSSRPTANAGNTNSAQEVTAASSTDSKSVEKTHLPHAEAAKVAPSPTTPVVESPSETAPKPKAPENVYVAKARTVKLATRKPQDLPGIHNFFKLSDNILSGSEPHEEASFATLQEMGVRTIISVDSKIPDAELAAKYGMRYVHVPHGYNGLNRETQLRLAKTYRDAEGPFYVHCFHGKHRGPAAAGIGRILLDGASEDQVGAEMLQYCGTSPKYPGLYETIAKFKKPTSDDFRTLDWEMSAEAKVDDIQGLMVTISRADDALEALSNTKFAMDPSHPDLDSLNEAVKIDQAYERGIDLSVEERRPDDYIQWMKDGKMITAKLVQGVRDLRAGTSDAEAVKKLFVELRANCAACHNAYRNETPVK